MRCSICGFQLAQTSCCTLWEMVGNRTNQRLAHSRNFVRLIISFLQLMRFPLARQFDVCKVNTNCRHLSASFIGCHGFHMWILGSETPTNLQNKFSRAALLRSYFRVTANIDRFSAFAVSCTIESVFRACTIGGMCGYPCFSTSRLLFVEFRDLRGLSVGQ